jgi:hypothetical protein
MHVGGKVYEKNHTDGVSSRISEQMNILTNLMKLLDKYKSADSHIAALIDQLKTVQVAYGAFDEVKNYNEDSDKPVALTPEHIGQLGALIEKVRSSFIAS